jgi:hypothetical protein
MSMIATIYRIPEEVFENLVAWNWEDTKSTEAFVSSFMGLEYLLAVGADEQAFPLYQSIFNPTLFVGPPGWQSLSFEQQMALYAERKMIFYLDPARIAAIDRLLENITEGQFRERFNAEELNENDVYPKAWNDDQGEDAAFNLNHLLQDLAKLKRIFRAAAAEGDYLVVYTG